MEEIMNQKQKDFLYTYWSRTVLGKEMIKSNHVSDSDLLFLMPNNVKRMHGLPLTRISGKKKRKQKEARRKNIFKFKLFDIIEEIIDKTIGEQIVHNDYFGKFVDVEDISIGDPNYFVDENIVDKFNSYGCTSFNFFNYNF